MNAFRPNLVVSSDVAFEEDSWSTILIGNVALSVRSHKRSLLIIKVVGPCHRCQMVNIDQESSNVNTTTYKALAKFRRKEGGQIAFGQHARLADPTASPVTIQPNATVHIK
jgi:hypothetical protein